MVAELVKKFAVNPVSIAIKDQLISKLLSGIRAKSALNFITNQDEAPVSLIWNPSEIVAANRRITPQFVFLFITSHDTIPQIIKINAPHNAIIPKPSSSLNKNQLITISRIIIKENR